MATQTIERYKDGKLIETLTVTVPDGQVNAQTLQDRAQAALAANLTFVNAAKPATAAAQASAAYDQTVRVTKECSVLIRMALGLVDDISGT